MQWKETNQRSSYLVGRIKAMQNLNFSIVVVNPVTFRMLVAMKNRHLNTLFTTERLQEKWLTIVVQNLFQI